MPYPIQSNWRPMKVFNGKMGQLVVAAEDSLASKTRKEPNKESLELELL